ncbi:UDP-N-acetylglucosamine--dolichyl-phosphate N-acetylglucosaminephosphotransferase-like [Oppia nitens]|uniref:UDP-N-acetylglucosamine--dolichyl-phosphate N-acetylglucosaminephosphotransferase-like n=1 Tax=Oppia nitens TaxID=1686743 RepID=UPI0023DB450C|nr:UDP-N-acetylglucosamine--dolichyl-phosphate N-acetylglucosaminephosphotransferase-like [Oppia nitens]
MNTIIQILINCLMSMTAFYITLKAIPQVRQLFIKANLFGIDQCKQNKDKKVAESQGVVAGCVYLVVMFLFIPIPFTSSQPLGNEWLFTLEDFRHEVFAQFISALLSICCMIFLGFADDVLDLRWRTKLLLPTIATLPLLMVYGITYNNTTVIVPKPLRDLVGYSVNLGPIYYLYLAMLAVFCTNAINIVAGINGIEAGQGLVIGLSIIVYNIIEFIGSSDQWQCHLFSLHFMLPFVAVTAALLYHNWYPSQVFVGDTYCYFAGMTFAVVGILGHFSKTMLLFFIPQVFNFLFSCPQLFHFVDCPRHRLPKYDVKTDRVYASTFRLKTNETKPLGALFIAILRTLRLVEYRKVSDNDADPKNKTLVATGVVGVNDTYECSNLTIINLILVKFGPMNEKYVTIILLIIQCLCTCLAFFIRYGISRIFY